MKTVVLILFIGLYAIMIAKPNIRTWAALAAAALVCALGVVPLRELPACWPRRCSSAHGTCARS